MSCDTPAPDPQPHARSRVAGWITVLVFAVLTSGCVHARDFRAPPERITPKSAYAETRRLRVDAGLLSPDTQDFVVDTSLTVAAVRGRLDFSTNLAHASIGVLSTQSKLTAYDGQWYALGGRVGLTYLNPRTLWLLPSKLRRELGSFHLVSVPIELWNSFPINQWFGVHLGLSYRASPSHNRHAMFPKHLQRSICYFCLSKPRKYLCGKKQGFDGVQSE